MSREVSRLTGVAGQCQLVVMAEQEQAVPVIGEAPPDWGGTTIRQFIDDFQVPKFYEIWDNGLCKVQKLEDMEEDDGVPPPEPGLDRTCPSARMRGLKVVASKAIWIRRFGRDMTTREDLLELAYRDIRTNETSYQWVTRAVVSDVRTIVSLSAKGLSINSGNAPQIVHYLDKAIALNAQRLEWVDVSRRVGAISTPQGWGWLMGEQWYGPQDTHVVPDPTLEGDFARGYGCRGDPQAWLDKFEEVVSLNSVARWLCYSTFAGPLLRHVNRRTFVIHHWGLSGKGKSALAKFGQTAWGNPALLTETFNRTTLSFTEIFTQSSDFPILFDELQASTVEDPKVIVYALTLEKGRRRSTKTGGLAKVLEDWRSVVRMTGEEPLVGKGSADKGGESNRVIQIAASAMTSVQAGALHRWCDLGHHGWGGATFVQKLGAVVNDPARLALLQQRYAELHRDLMAPDYECLGDRMNHLTVVALAQALAAVWLFGADPRYARAQAIRDAQYVAGLLLEDHEQTLTSTDAGLQMLRDHCDSEAGQWLDTADAASLEAIQQRRWTRLFGILQPSEVWILQGPANKLLKREGLSPRAVWRDLRERGVLMVRDGRNLSTVRTLGAFRNRVYVLSRDRFFESEKPPVPMFDPDDLDAPEEEG